jgi:hypothetical protein
MAANATQSNVELINALMGIPSKLFGSTQNVTTSGGSSTTQSNISQAGVDALLKSLMEGTTGRPGLAQVAQGQRSAGLYNTNVRSMMVNDLMARSAAEVEKERAGTTTTKEPSTVKTKTPGALGGMGLGGLLLGAGALGLGTKKGRELLGLGDAALTDSVIGADVAQAAMGAGAAADWTTGNLDVIGGLTDPNYVDTLGEFGDWVGLPSDIIDSTTVSMSGLADPSYIDPLGGFGDIAEGTGEFTGMPYAGAVLNLAQGDVGGAAGSAGGAYLGNMVLPGIGGVIGSILGGELFGDDGGCFITTAVCKVYGKPDDCDELQTLRKYRDTYLKDTHPADIQTYYDIAPTIVLRINERDDADVVWTGLYKTYIVPAIQHIQDGEYELAYTTYKAMVQEAQSIAQGE